MVLRRWRAALALIGSQFRSVATWSRVHSRHGLQIREVHRALSMTFAVVNLGFRHVEQNAAWSGN